MEAAFEELVEKRKEVMEELVRTMKELTQTLMHLLKFEKAILSTEEMLKLTKIGQNRDKKQIEKKLDNNYEVENKVNDKQEDEQQMVAKQEQSLLDQGVLPEEERGLVTPSKEAASNADGVDRRRRNRRG